MTALEQGRLWRNQYISATTVPPAAHKEPREFMLGVLGDYPLAYATNRSVLDAMTELLAGMGVSAVVRPFVNLECRFGLYGSQSQWKAVAFSGDYQI